MKHLLLTLCLFAVPWAISLSACAQGRVTAAPFTSTAVLRTVWLVEADAAKGVTPDAGVVVQVAELDRAPLRSLLMTQLGQPIEPRLVAVLVAEVNRALAMDGLRFTIAAAPEQDVTDGVLRIEVQRGRLGQLELTGASDPQRVRETLRTREGELLDAGQFEADLAWLELAQPGLRAEAALRPGRVPGAVDVGLKVSEPPRLQGSVGLDNSGSRVSGQERVSLALGATRLMNADDQVSYRLNASSNLHNASTHKIDYVSALDSRHLLGIGLTSSRSKSRLPEPLSQRGSSDEWALRYEVPLRLAGPWTDRLTLTAESKRSDNNLLFSSMPVTDTVTRVVQLTLGYGGTAKDLLGSSRAMVSLVASPGRRGGHNDDLSFDAVRSGAKARYKIFRLQLNRDTGLSPGVSWQVSMNGQWSRERLLGSEQLGAGGASSVRGFNEGAAYADSGMVLRNDLRLPPLAIAPQWVLSPMLFIDAAHLRVQDRQPGERNERLGSMGAGVETALPMDLYLSIHLGRRLRSTLTNQHSGASHGHASLHWFWR